MERELAEGIEGHVVLGKRKSVVNCKDTHVLHATERHVKWRIRARGVQGS